VGLPDLKLDEFHDEREHPARPGPARPAPLGQFGTAASAIGASARRAAAILTPASLWRSHRIFTILAVASVVPRVLAALAFRPALLTSDSFLYIQEATTGTLGVIRPSGYSNFLDLMHVFPHPLLAITTAQHLMGIAIAAIVYGLLRYWGLPAWGAALAAVPVLFDTREIALESYILPDTLYCLVIMVAVALLLTKRTPRLWQCVLAGLLLAYATVLRGNGLPLAVVAAAYLLIRKVGWRAFTTSAVAFAIPVFWYALAFNAAYGEFNITRSDGIFLWSRTTSFANCAIIKPPRDLVPLCPNKSTRAPAKAPAWSISTLVDGSTPANYLWAPSAWWRHDARPGFSAYNNKLGMQFALDAIKAQPLGYLQVSARDLMLVFVNSDRALDTNAMAFTALPRFLKLPSSDARELKAYAVTTSNTNAVEPYAYFLYLYQQPVYFPGLVFFGVLVAGLVGVIRKRRQWGGPAALPWVLAVLSIVLPVLLTQSFYRYDLTAIPLACVAAGLAFVRQRPRYSLATAGPALAAQAKGPQAPRAQAQGAQAQGAQGQRAATSPDPEQPAAVPRTGPDIAE
jgi:hypothetical protein